MLVGGYLLVRTSEVCVAAGLLSLGLRPGKFRPPSPGRVSTLWARLGTSFLSSKEIAR